jgi:Family of unknown function (DUF5372)
VTHPFHPLCDQRFELLSHHHSWGEQRVHFRDGAGRLRSLPARWTDVEPPDPFVVLAAGQALWRVEELLALAALVRELAA